METALWEFGGMPVKKYFIIFFPIRRAAWNPCVLMERSGFAEHQNLPSGEPSPTMTGEISLD